MANWYLRVKAEKYLGVPPLFLVNHPYGEELFMQAMDAMHIDNEIEKALSSEARFG